MLCAARFCFLSGQAVLAKSIGRIMAAGSLNTAKNRVLTLGCVLTWH